MNRLTSLQRKLIYFVAIIVLLLPINWLGRPAGTSAKTDSEQAERASGVSGGGRLADLRSKYDLGESNLGNVDPSSATMNLVLVGLRGIAANQLWMKAIENQERKNWAELETNVNSIILLQPHFVRVWEFQGWNLAYNVSGEWDLVQDKYYWIKRGAKFTIRGTRRNAKSPELLWWVGIILGQKISRHDAWQYMRKFFNPAAYDENDPFVGDPEIREETGEIKPDPELNPRGIDNHLVAKQWFLKANDVDRISPQQRMTSVAFRQHPARSQLAYAEMLQKEGRFDEQDEMIDAWQLGLTNWTDRYRDGNRPGLGQELFDTTWGLVRLEVGPDDENELQELIRRDDPPGQFSIEEKRRAVQILRGIVNYNYWKTRAHLERQGKAIRAHKAIHDGKGYLKSTDEYRAIQALEQGLTDFTDLLQTYPELKSESNTAEEILIAVMAWRRAQNWVRFNQGDRELPENALPWQDATSPKDRRRYRLLRELHKQYEHMLSTFRDRYNREFPGEQ